MTAAWRDVWLWLEGKQARGWTAEDTQAWPHQEPAWLLERIRQQPATLPGSPPLHLHLTEDWPPEVQRTFHDAVVAHPTPYADWQIIFDVPRTAAPPACPPRPSVIIVDLWPDAERDDGQAPPLFKKLVEGLPDAVQWRGVRKVERELLHPDLPPYSLLVIIAHGSERQDAPPFRLADQREWELPPGLRLPPLVILLACGNADHNLVTYGRTLRKTGAQTVLVPTGRLDARPADRFLRDFLQGWQTGQRVDALVWRAQQQPGSEYGAGRLVILGRGDLHVGSARGPAEWPDTELQNAARALTPDSVPALQALLERLTWQCYLQEGHLEAAVDALYEALDLEYDDRDREPPLLELLVQHGSQWALLTQSWVLPYRLYLAEIYDHRHLSAGSGGGLPKVNAPHACYHYAKGHYRAGAYPRAAHQLAAGLHALPLARWSLRSGLGLLGTLVNVLIDLNLPDLAQAAFDQLDLVLSRASSASADREILNHWDRRARLALRHGQPRIALGHYRQKQQRDQRDPDRELAWLLYVAAWADLPEGPNYAAEVQAKLSTLYQRDEAFGRGNETAAYLLRALALWAWRSGDAGAAAGVAAWTAKLVEPLERIQDPGPFAMTLGYLHLYVQNHAPIDATLPDWREIADALEREGYWFELASMAHGLERPLGETQRALEQFQAQRRAVGVELAGLPEPLQQQVMTPWAAMRDQRDVVERALLLAGNPSAVAEWVKKGMLPL